ncbi:MAG: STM4013/SEN3800 family hydrolase [Myxococcaceae bacterium]|nr:STM4013/SEN3800 family hydrolase [Myxococcaceae bacterium]
MNLNPCIGTHDVLFLVLDTLRFDVADEAFRAGHLPTLASTVLGAEGWEARHTPGSFTYAAHQAFFSGFLPTPAHPGRHPRLFATRFGGSETTTPETVVFDAPDIVHGFAARGYRTICIGGVGFFNPATPLGRALPGFFDEAHWSEAMGVTEPRSTEHQVRLACERLAAVDQRVFLFINVSALHQPNRFYVPGAVEDSKATHAAALRYVDAQLPPLFEALKRRGPSVAIVCSDHGTCYGDDGYVGHRLAHPVVWTVPYAEAVLPGR